MFIHKLLHVYLKKIYIEKLFIYYFLGKNYENSTSDESDIKWRVYCIETIVSELIYK